jgi:Protein of unknown function (DUF669)
VTHEPVLLKQYKLLGAVIDAPWATRLDHKIARRVIDRYFVKFGNARASLRYLEQATGSARNKIIDSLRRIIEHGVFSIIRQGIGTRPTEYALNFEFPSGTLQGTSTSGALQGTSEVPQEEPLAASSGAVQGTETYLPSVLTSTLTVSRIEDTPAVPTAPPVSGGATASTAGPAVDPFEELWAVYPRKHQRAKALAAYRALAPEPGLHATLVDKAAQWAAHYQQTGTEKKWWKHLHRWLEDQCYLEDLPVAYEDPKEAAIARRASGKNQSPGKSGSSMKAPMGTHRLTITAAEVTKSTNNDEILALDFRVLGGPHDGKEFSHSFVFDSEDNNSREEGQNTFAQFRQAAGKESPQDASDFVDCVLRATVSKRGIRYGVGM